MADQLHEVVEVEHGLVGHHRGLHMAAYVGQAEQVPAPDRLLDQLDPDPGVLERP